MLEIKCIYRDGNKRKAGRVTGLVNKGFLLEGQNKIFIKNHLNNQVLYIHFKNKDEINDEQNKLVMEYYECDISQTAPINVHLLVGDYILEYKIEYFMWRGFKGNPNSYLGDAYCEYKISKIYKHNGAIDEINLIFMMGDFTDGFDNNRIKKIIEQCEEV